MIRKTEELEGRPLDYAVALALGGVDQLGGSLRVLSKGWSGEMIFCPSESWKDGGPIIERECLSISYWGERSKFGQHEKREQSWECRHPSHRTQSRRTVGFGQTPLIAAMRCYIASKLGHEVEIPDSLA